ncbi:hypothetical protein ACQKCH_03935 [Nubsella zeaxanthinifaciens]|uniref:hypothetical protein n=1 Tax=Nubsella zeaxanthinifaciens TaxID=392412 RepID=UPI003D04E8AA
MKQIKLLSYMLAVAISVSACKKSSSDPSTESPSDDTPVVGLATAVGSPLGQAISKTIGTNGGTLVSDDERLILTIPQGALEKDVLLTLQRITNFSPNGLQDAYRISGEAGQLKKQASLCWKYTSTSQPNGGGFAIAYQSKDRIWNATKDIHVSKTDSTVCFNNIKELVQTDWSFVNSICMLPKHTDTVLLGSAENFMITGISMGNRYWNPLPKAKIYLAPDIVGETVNGVEYGDNYNGTFFGEGYTENDFSARYLAPKYKVPTVNPVEIKAIVKTGEGQMEEITTYLRIRRGNTSLSIAAEGSASQPRSYGALYDDGRLSLTINDDDIISPKVMTNVHFEIHGFNKNSASSYGSGETLEVVAWQSGKELWKNKYLARLSNNDVVERFGEGNVTVTSILPVIGEINSGRQGSIIKGTYNITCYRHKQGGEYQYDRTGVTGTFETFVYL